MLAALLPSRSSAHIKIRIEAYWELGFMYLTVKFSGWVVYWGPSSSDLLFWTGESE